MRYNTVSQKQISFFAEMIGGGSILLSRTEVIFKNIFLFWVLCALSLTCMEPTRNHKCNNTSLHNGEYAGNNLE